MLVGGIHNLFFFQGRTAPLTSPSQARHDRADGYAELAGYLAIAQPLQTDQEQDLPVFDAQGSEGSHEIYSGAAIRRGDTQFKIIVHFGNINSHAAPALETHEIYVKIQ